MGVTCPNCSADNRSSARFCYVCGTVLTGLSPAAPQPSQPSQPPPVKTTLMQGPPPGALAAKASLVMADGTSLELESMTIIGRDASQCTLSFPSDNRLSRRHARLQETNGVWTIEDLGSSNGTYVNQQRLQTVTALKPNDQIGLGSATYLFLLGGQVQPNPGLPNLGIVPAQPVLPAQPPNNPLPVGGAFSPIGPTPVSQEPPGGWRAWNTQPTAEGYVRNLSSIYSMKKDDLLKRGIAAAALAIFISPAVAFIPMMHGNDIAARDMRIEDHFSGHMVDVKILGDMMGNINQGDAVAVWGQVRGGLLIMEAAFNYATQTDIRIKK